MSLPSSGRARFLTNVKVRSGPSTASSQQALYTTGETVNYDSVVSGDGRTWISYIGRSGQRRYCCAIDRDGSRYVEVGSVPPVPVPRPTPSGIDGLPFLQRQSRHPGVRGEGCMFCAACWLGGLNTIGEVDDAFDWCVAMGYVRRSDALCNGLSREPLGRKIAQHYRRSFREGCRIQPGTHHFYVVDGSGREVYNSAGWGVLH